jgi:hypothetical protein
MEMGVEDNASPPDFEGGLADKYPSPSALEFRVIGQYRARDWQS